MPAMRIALALAWAMAALSAAPAGAEILFARDSAVPRAVREFAWHAVETRCAYQAYERAQRSFLAYRTRVERVDGATVYSIQIVSDVDWRKTDPPAFVEMTVADDGGLRLTALRSSFIRCAP
jgi:hypothetical protein